MAESIPTDSATEVQVNPTTFFDDVFTDRTAKLRDQADQLREDLGREPESELPARPTPEDDDADR